MKKLIWLFLIIVVLVLSCTTVIHFNKTNNNKIDNDKDVMKERNRIHTGHERGVELMKDADIDVDPQMKIGNKEIIDTVEIE